MAVDNRLLDDLSRVAAGAFAAFSGVREEVEARMREQFERVLSRFDLVTREEFEAVKAMAQRAREEQEALAVRLAALESSTGTAAKPRVVSPKAAVKAPKVSAKAKAPKA